MLKRNPKTARTDGAESAASQYTKPSKSSMKREMTARQVLGRELVDLPRDALTRVPLPEDLEQAVTEARRITDHEGKRRQLQYIGKLMRSVEIEPIEAALAEIRGASHEATARLHQLEAWRDRLMADDKQLEVFAERYLDDDASIGELRSTIRLAKKEREAERPPRHQRALFQQLKSMIEAKD